MMDLMQLDWVPWTEVPIENSQIQLTLSSQIPGMDSHVGALGASPLTIPSAYLESEAYWKEGAGWASAGQTMIGCMVMHIRLKLMHANSMKASRGR